MLAQYCHRHEHPIEIMNWCDTCNTTACAQCAYHSGEHKDHTGRLLSSVRAELRTRAEQLPPQLARFERDVKVRVHFETL